MKGLLHTPYFTSLVTVLLLVVMLGLGGAAYPGLLSTQVIFNLLIDNAFLLVIAVGMTFVIVSGGIDLSVGSVLALSTMIAAWLLNVAHWPPTAGDRHRAGAGRRVWRQHGRADPLFQTAALHRHPGRHVSGARAVLSDQHQFDHHRRPAVRGHVADATGLSGRLCLARRA